MATDNAFFETWTPRAQAILRIVTAYLLIPHGTAKLFGVPHQAMFDGLQLMSLIGIVGILVVMGGVLLFIGLRTRPVVFVLCGFMAVAYFMAHASQENVLLPMLNGGELAGCSTVACSCTSSFRAPGPGAWTRSGVEHERAPAADSVLRKQAVHGLELLERAK